jgi:hypothetical protein
MGEPIEKIAGSGAERRRPRSADPSAIHDLFMSRLEEIERRVSSELARPAEASGALQQWLLDVARELWAHARSGAAAAAHPAAFLAELAAGAPADDLGVDERYRDGIHDVLRPMCRLWLGLDAHADEQAPDMTGPTVLFFNRAAVPLPVDPLVLWTYFREHAGADGRRVHALWSPSTLALPFVGERLNRLGVFAATAANLRALLERGSIVLVFPEGDQALAKTYERRYRIARFDAGFLVETAIDCGARILPGAVLGNEESFPLMTRIGGWPVTPFFPALGLFGLVPLPIKWQVRVGAPVQYSDELHDTARAGAVTDALRARMQELLVGLLARRRTLFSG